MWKLQWMFIVCVLTASVSAEFDNFNELLSKSKLFNEFQNRLAVLEERDLVQQRQISQLTNDLAEQTQENAILQETVKELQSLIGVKNTPVPENNTQLSTPRLVKTEQTIPQQSSNRQRRILKRVLSIRQQVNRADVAFSVGLTHNTLHAGADQNIVFDKVLANIGNGYNAHHGVFIAPVAGTYVFYSSILAYNNQEAFCRFVVNGSHSYSMYARGTDNRHDQGSNMIIVQLNQGDDVSVQNMVADHAVFGNSDIYSTFSGFLLRGDGEFGSIVG